MPRRGLVGRLRWTVQGNGRRLALAIGCHLLYPHQVAALGARNGGTEQAHVPKVLHAMETSWRETSYV